MNMTPEKLAFIKGDTLPATKPNFVGKTAAEANVEKTIDLPGSPETTEHTVSKARAGRRSGKSRETRQDPDASEVLDQLLVPITMRLQHRTAQALRRASLEQRLSRAKPDTQQEIAEEALADWLVKQGFLE